MLRRMSEKEIDWKKGRACKHSDVGMKPELDDRAIQRETRLLVYSPRLIGGLVALGLVNVLLIVAAARMPYFPTDLLVARTLQSLAFFPLSWASSITATADKPWCFALLALVAMVAWLLCGWRAALVALPVFFGLWLFGIWLSPLIAQPRPSPELIRVVGHPKGYAFPSIFALLGKFWAPVPWMLEVTIVLELALGRFVEGIVIAVLLVSNASLGLFQETRRAALWICCRSGFPCGRGCCVTTHGT
jgi:zinc transporter ZupT